MQGIDRLSISILDFIDTGVKENGPSRWLLLVVCLLVVVAVRFVALNVLGGSSFTVIMLLLGVIVLIKMWFAQKPSIGDIEDSLDVESTAKDRIYVRSRRGKGVAAAAKAEGRENKCVYVPKHTTTLSGKHGSNVNAVVDRGGPLPAGSSEDDAQPSRSTRDRLMDRRKHKAPYRGLTEQQRSRRRRFKEREPEDCTPDLQSPLSMQGSGPDDPSAPDPDASLGDTRDRFVGHGNASSESANARAIAPSGQASTRASGLARLLRRAGAIQVLHLLSEEAVTEELLRRCLQHRGEDSVRKLLREAGVERAGHRESILLELGHPAELAVDEDNHEHGLQAGMPRSGVVAEVNVDGSMDDETGRLRQRRVYDGARTVVGKSSHGTESDDLGTAIPVDPKVNKRAE